MMAVAWWAWASLMAGDLAEPPPELVSVSIKDSLEASVVRVHPMAGPAIAAEMARLLRWRGDLYTQLQRDDSLAALVRPAGPNDSEPTLLALRYMGAELQLRAYRFAGADGIARYYDEQARLVEPQLQNSPVPAYEQITEIVQKGGRGRRRHHGIDLKAPQGTPIRLPFAGRVVRTNWAQRVNGHCIEVAYDNGKVARFLHLSVIDRQVRAGVHLAVGASLGQVGSTGHSNAAHLHYEILVHGVPVEPLHVHGQRAVSLDGPSQAAFKVQRDAYDRALRGPAAVAPLELLGAVQDCVPLSSDLQKPLGCQP